MRSWSEELRLIAELAGDQPLPLLMFHDVCWPHARRDTYYDVLQRRSHSEEERPPIGKGVGLAPGNPGTDPRILVRIGQEMETRDVPEASDLPLDLERAGDAIGLAEKLDRAIEVPAICEIARVRNLLRGVGHRDAAFASLPPE